MDEFEISEKVRFGHDFSADTVKNCYRRLMHNNVGFYFCIAYELEI